MGATGWFHETTWQQDTQRALDEVCAALFAAGEYDKLWEADPDMFEEMAAQFEGFDGVPGLAESLEAIATGGEPTTIDAAAFLNQESGFGSLLDCRSVSTKPDFAAVSPLEASELQRLFNTEQPSADAIRAAEDALHESPVLERWHGRYLTGYDADTQPTSLFFVGFSGD